MHKSFVHPVAVLMSVYHGDSPFAFRRAVLSTLEQRGVDGTDIRIYLGVDGPISAELLAEIERNRELIYRIVVFKRNRGLAHVLNDLIGMLSEEALVFRMDSDDECFPDRFSKQLAFMRENRDIDILGTAIIERHPDSTERLVTYPVNHEQALRSMCWRTPIAHPTACIRRKVFDVLGGYPTDSQNEDIALWFNAALNGFQFASLPEPLLYFSIGPGFWKRRGLSKAIGEFQCYVSGLYRLEGFSWRLAIPTARFLFRLSPVAIRQLGYSLGMRRKRDLRERSTAN